MAKREDVAMFLREFKVKMKVFQILFRDDRRKNTQALASLELTPAGRMQILESIEVMDYCEGPLDDNLFGIASMWVFGKPYKAVEIYIKISMGSLIAR